MAKVGTKTFFKELDNFVEIICDKTPQVPQKNLIFFKLVWIKFCI